MVEGSKALTRSENTETNPDEENGPSPKASLVERVKIWRNSMGERWSKLHANQIIYVIALVLFLMVDGDAEYSNTALWLVGALAFFGMARELWAIFTKVWESTLGRLLLLVMYAAIANFTLALASQKINMVIGADPSYLYHTQGVATLLMLPLWIMIVSLVAVIVAFGLSQILKLITGLFIIMRIIGKSSKPKEAFPRTFVIIRLILLFPVIVTMSSAVEWYAKQLNLDTAGALSIGATAENVTAKKFAELSLAGVEEALQDQSLSEEERAELLDFQNKLQNGLSDKIAKEVIDNIKENTKTKQIPKNEIPAQVEPSQQEPSQQNSEPTQSEVVSYFLDDIIASFVYHFEAFKFSHCSKTEAERVVYITESEILAVSKDPLAPNGYKFSTRTCVVNSTLEVDSSPLATIAPPQT